MLTRGWMSGPDSLLRDTGLGGDAGHVVGLFPQHALAAPGPGAGLFRLYPGIQPLWLRPATVHRARPVPSQRLVGASLPRRGGVDSLGSAGTALQQQHRVPICRYGPPIRRATGLERHLLPHPARDGRPAHRPRRRGGGRPVHRRPVRAGRADPPDRWYLLPVIRDRHLACRHPAPPGAAGRSPLPGAR